MALTVILQLSPEVESELRERIAERNAEEVRRLLADALTPTVEALLQETEGRLSDEEFEAIADQLADEVAGARPPGAPPLSDYAVSRAGIYEDERSQ
jgi:antitoxin ParD1/3/4